MERTTILADANANTGSDRGSNVIYEKPSHEPSILTSTSLQSDTDGVANKVPEKGGHVIDEHNDTALEPVQSRHPSVRDASSIPNGGLWAWLQVLGAFFLLFNSW
jgi:hypothetical protein